jgi:hypothetical protein
MNPTPFPMQVGPERKTETFYSWQRSLASKSFLTLDRGVEYEQNLKGREIAVIVLSAKSSRLSDLLPGMPAVLNALRSIRAGELIRVSD